MPENRNHGIHLVALQGSVRPGNNTAKALALVADEIQKHPGTLQQGKRPMVTTSSLKGSFLPVADLLLTFKQGKKRPFIYLRGR